MPSPFPCSPVIRAWLWKKIQIEKRNMYMYIYVYIYVFTAFSNHFDTSNKTEDVRLRLAKKYNIWNCSLGFLPLNFFHVKSLLTIKNYSPTLLDTPWQNQNTYFGILLFYWYNFHKMTYIRSRNVWYRYIST